jgi:BirA family biotin operon repressor/biotin-[acetyl-CoA-carboxylase] ligase
MQWSELAPLRENDWLQRIEFQQSLASTNDRAAQLAAEDYLACPALVLAAEQTAGRGRGGNRWWSASGGLMFSLVLERTQNAAAGNWSGYSLAAGLAICEALEAVTWRQTSSSAGPESQTRTSAATNGLFTVKWPNDVYAGERKICGILCESPTTARGRLIVGIGVNVNNSFQTASPELAATAMALCDLDGQKRSLCAVLSEILQNIQQRFHELEALGFAPIHGAWQARSLLTGRTVQLQLGQQSHVGRCLGIDETGALVLQTELGRQAFAAGSILGFE